MTTIALLDHFSALKDPRQAWKVIYPLPEVLLTVLCATMAGTENFADIERWAKQKFDFLRRFLPFERGVPSHDTLNDVMNALPAGLFSDCFVAVVASLRDEDPDIFAIDGKSSRRAHAAGKDELSLSLDRDPCHALRDRRAEGGEAVGQRDADVKPGDLALEIARDDPLASALKHSILVSTRLLR